ncbi:hypothetical protein Poly30_14850 [Planctomycetes bacterium Poly30]|uniref:DUF1579 domain-containing protein n=1 Tax=Saltatorellus ferox TaxID=2528018 RepID=A0A518EPH0_9BACT|nr:hypothetical protein Poly30_14850 [Planctomycetes bacterium Poly30]
MLNLKTLCVSALLLSAAAAATTLALRSTAPQEAEAPTREHGMLMESVGEWEGTLEMMMPGMEGKFPATDTITAFGPFWTQSMFESDFMGMAYSGTGVMGFDPKTKKFVGTWIQNTDSSFMVMHGTMNEAGEMEMKWEAPLPGSDELVPHRSTTKYTKDTYVNKFYAGEGDEEMHQMTISMKRKK